MFTAALVAFAQAGAPSTVSTAPTQDKVICKREDDQADVGSRLRGRGDKVCKKASEWRQIQQGQQPTAGSGNSK
ncbi:hypothetical protein G7078_04505 [Sphingomonas sinipercae]|uniref:Uncharacterized protein n=1 Tax=Sphingomonas sinipercae TaxID=2714944 RepID=A0A6G7ZMH8_9SPHN|nr:hypothetical protein [Sphingomonas sinipercae]QIL02120.1 hypothetical protein G7078_04505 [Sphingomonas sinipercae]